MIGYLVDENVLREIRPGGHANVLAWHKGIEQADLRISVMTLFEKRRGWERRLRTDPALSVLKLAELDMLVITLGARLLSVDGAIVAEWARLVGAKNKDRLDRALVATARVHDLVLVTRNVAHMRGCDVRVLDPFRRNPSIETV